MWRPTWITNLKSVLSQAFSVKLRAAVLTSVVTIFSRTRRGQPGDFRACKIVRILASHILRYVMVKRRMARRPQLWNCEIEGREKALCHLRRTDPDHHWPFLLYIFLSISLSLFCLLFSTKYQNNLIHRLINYNYICWRKCRLSATCAK